MFKKSYEHCRQAYMRNGKINLRELMAEARAIHQGMKYGAMSYERAKELTKTHLEIINKESAKIARRYGVRPTKVRFSDLNRGI